MLTSKFDLSEDIARKIDIGQLVRLVEFLEGTLDYKLDIQFRTYMKACLAHKGIAKLELTKNTLFVYSTILTLLGPIGVLPAHYFQYVVRHIKEHESSLLDFLDVFYNRMLQSLYLMLRDSDLVLILRKYSLNRGKHAPLLIRSLSAFSGINSSQECLNAILHCTGVMLVSRPACSLHRLLSFFLRMPVVIEQFKLLKMPLEQCHKTLLAKQNSSMNVNFYVGHYAYLYQSMISIKISDLDVKNFRALMRQKKDKDSPLHTLLRAYLGDAIRHDLALEAKDEAKITQLSYIEPISLGFDMWCSTVLPSAQ